jgi:hypothetical protein
MDFIVADDKKTQQVSHGNSALYLSRDLLYCGYPEK